MILVILLFVFNRSKFKGQTLFLYMIGYGVLRAYLETLRTDQLLIWNTTFPVSVLTSIIFAVVGVILSFVFARREKIAVGTAASGKSYAPDLEDDSEEKEADAFVKLFADSLKNPPKPIDEVEYSTISKEQMA